MKKTILHQLNTDGRSLDGMSYVIRCGDGSTVVIDGSMPEDADTLYAYLRELAGDKDPVVDAWFFTHAHPDHTFAAKTVAERYADRITAKKLIYRFPDEEFLHRKEPDCLSQIPAFENAVKVFGAEHILPSAGDRYLFGDTEFEILFTCDDLPSLLEDSNQCLNDTSLVFRMTAAGQTVLFLGDVQESANRVMIKRYGKSLKSDVCQVAHHGCFSSTARFYDHVDPEILLWPCAEKNFYRFIQDTAASRHLAGEMKVKDIYLHGLGTVALEMPIPVRDTPFLPQVPPQLPLELKTELVIPMAKAEPELDDPYSSAWDGCEWLEINGRIHYDKIGCRSFCKILWKDDSLYFNVRVEKPFVSNPDRYSSAHCDTARIYLTDEAVTDRNAMWSDREENPGNFFNLKIYPEEKNFGGKRVRNVGGRGDCISSYLVENERFYMTACVKMGRQRHSGETVGVNVEVTCVNEPFGPRLYNAVLVSDFHNGHYACSPYAIIFAQLQ